MKMWFCGTLHPEYSLNPRSSEIVPAKEVQKVLQNVFYVGQLNSYNSAISSSTGCYTVKLSGTILRWLSYMI